MPLSFIKKATGGETAGATNPNQQSTKPSMFGGKTAAGTNGAAKAAGKLPGFFKHGQAAKAAIEHADAKAEAAKAEAGKLWRFWMPAGEDRMITFLDGELDAEACSTCRCGTNTASRSPATGRTSSASLTRSLVRSARLAKASSY
jgi:hypothetical protein